jgi:hypothetical protein
MFTIDPTSPLFSSVIELIGQSPGITVGELQQRLRGSADITVTIQHIYRLVNKLVEARIVMKRKQALELNLLWLSTLELFAHDAKANLQQGKDFVSVADVPVGKRAQFSVRSVQEAQALWHHILVQLNRIVPPSRERVLYKYYSHAWWILRDEEDLSFYERIAKHGVQCHWLIGNDTYLDRRAITAVAHIFAIATADKPPFPTQGFNLNVFGDYVLQCVFPAAISDHMQLLFNSVKSAKDWKPHLLKDMFELRMPITISVLHSPAKAAEYKAKIDRLIPGHVRKKIR